MLLNLVIIVLMILLTAFFVAAEFGFVKIRKTRLESLSNEGNKNATLSLHIVNHLDEYLSACQLGITLTSLAIGWIGESTIEHLLHPVLSLVPISASMRTLISFILAFAIMTFVHVVIGELIPKSISISKTEKTVLSVARPLHWFYKISFPFIWLLNKSASGIGKLIGVEIAGEGEEHHSEEELLIIASQSLSHGEINSEEFELIENSFRFDQTLAREIMVSRPDMDILDESLTAEEALNISIKEGHSRYPVVHETKDNIIGYITQKDLIKLYIQDPTSPITSEINKILVIFENTPIKELLEEMKTEKKHIAILVDEYGGTSGLVTIEDIIEEVFGDIQDEQDHELPMITMITQNSYLVDGRTELIELSKQFDLNFEESHKDNGKSPTSIGGWLLDHDPNQSKVGSFIDYQGYGFEITDMEHGVIITQVKITKIEE
ncbi:hemolysin family protein [Vagococcus xieshaowenii]|uniref:HlyC/CorC family transporter n=1 Tax=Vagococcus xieshaowenii TaxID=2562451 RepID=A0AAJ5EGH0_9ENTE|nr:hemolysin family protein [Vagococcus xieshaowenii]QCA28412.1 HlyC/CorC family transporter [Vagococcus xieshaowenii]TFZ42832.1 HlyC/CorC family transporter [Vagococcus xieshaowenii]